MPGKILIGFQPAGKMETFFQEAAKISDFAADEKLYRACEMEIVGPPLSLGQSVGLRPSSLQVRAT
jgi:hypothetical protein